MLTGLFGFSLAELFVVSALLMILFKTGRIALELFSNTKGFIKQIPQSVFKLPFILAVIYLVFNLMWGLNYNRETFAEISGLPVEPASVEELAELAAHLTHRANELREWTAEDERGVMLLSNGVQDVFNRAHLGYLEAAKIYPELGGQYGPPKGVMLSRYLSHAGIAGLYFPFTAEANVNTKIPHFKLPSTTAHEMAHQRGFAREDEANYIAYLTCTLHPDLSFQYSGVMMALMYTMNTLYTYNMEAWAEIRSEYSDGMNRDLQDYREYLARYQGPAKETFTRINDTYLIANRQEEGVQSYSDMVDLLLAEFRTNCCIQQ